MRRINDSIYLSDKQDYTKLTKKSRRVGNRIYSSYYYDYKDFTEEDSIKENCETISPIHTNIPVTLVVS